jgi:hypothetical protein
MQPISSFVPLLPSATDRQLPTGFRTSDVLRVKASTETHADLTVLTAGGDRVTLSAESLLRASYASVDSQSSDPQLNVSLHATASEVRRSNSFVVSVEGQLDQQEEADLQRLVSKLQNVVKDFLGGDLDGAVSKALQVGDLGTVSGFQLNVQESEQISVLREHRVFTPDSVDVMSPQNPFTDSTGGNLPNLVTQIVDSINDANIELSKLLQHLPQVLKEVFEQIEPNISDKSLAQLFSAVETLLRQTSQLPDLTSPRIGIDIPV